MAFLGINVDHVATLRQARYRDSRQGLVPEPDPLTAARISLRAGASSITVHLREDQRHIQESDVRAIRGLRGRLNLEMAVTPGMIRKAVLFRPDEVCLVPENRLEVTTEGGLDVAAQVLKVRDATRKLQKAGIAVSLFIDPELPQVMAAAVCGATCIELHTGAYANARPSSIRRELRRHVDALNLAVLLNLQVNAGHGLNYSNTAAYLAALPSVHTLNIGHSIISRSLFDGLDHAVRDMVRLIRRSSDAKPHK